jgi:prevent-host-death family protein
MKTIPQRELRNRIGPVLREVEQGRPMRITVDGRPVADLVPIAGIRRTFVARAEIENLLAHASLDRNFARDLDAATGATSDEL